MAVCKWYLLNIRCFLSCVQIFEHFLNTLRPHFCVALCHLAVGAKIALKRGKKNCKPLFRDLHFLCELFRSRIIKFYVIWLKNVVFRLFAHSFRPRPPFNPIFSFSLKTHNLHVVWLKLSTSLLFFISKINLSVPRMWLANPHSILQRGFSLSRAKAVFIPPA